MNTRGAPDRPCRRGFTLVECAAVLAVVAVLSAVVVPSWQGHLRRAARIDAVQALTRLQSVQEQHRSTHGLYAGDLAALRGVAAISAQGHYTLSVARTGPEAYRATASARGRQAEDRDCVTLTLDVSQGDAHVGPSTRCWNR